MTYTGMAGRRAIDAGSVGTVFGEDEPPSPALVRSRSRSSEAGTTRARYRAMAREEALNTTGALPLLAIGGFLLAYGVVLALQEASVPGHHLALWELFVGVGVTVFGGGVVSLFSAVETEEVREVVAPKIAPGPIAGSPVRSVSPPLSAMDREVQPSPPPWWEGPPRLTGRAPPDVSVARSDRPDLLPKRDRPRAPSIRTPAPRATALASAEPELPKDVADALAEWERVAHPTAPSVLWPTPRPPYRGVSRCTDCDRPTGDGRPTATCSHCGEPLCPDCARSLARSGRGVLCMECLSRPAVR